MTVTLNAKEMHFVTIRLSRESRLFFTSQSSTHELVTVISYNIITTIIIITIMIISIGNYRTHTLTPNKNNIPLE